MNKLVSIITPSFNSAEYISKTIQSVLLQTYDDWEMIIVDDCSTDNSVNIINDFVSIDSRIKLIQLQKNSGAAVARNTGIQYAQGRFIAFLDSDDSWNDRKLEKQVHFMLANDYAFTYTAYHKVNELDENIGNMYIPNKVNYHQLLKTCIIGCLTAMYDVHKLGKVEFPLIRKRQDFALWLKILKQESFAYGLQEDLASYTVRSDSISANKFKAAQYNWQLYRHIEKLPLLKSCYYFFSLCGKGYYSQQISKSS
ncbi:glycosyltransferase family 2 protein [Acinetobacter baumannii]